MTTPTYTLISSATLTSSVSQVLLTPIANTFRDLVIVVDAIASSNTNVSLRFNDDDDFNYFAIRIVGNGTSASSASFNGTVIPVTEQGYPTATQRSLIIVNIMDYAQPKQKTTLSRANNGNRGVDGFVGRWASTSPITKITLLASNFAATTTINLYGIGA